MTSKVLYEASGGIARITMNDPDRRNAAKFGTTEGMDLIKSLDYLNTLRVVSFLSEDLQEGAQAFMDKRSPQFTGR